MNTETKPADVPVDGNFAVDYPDSRGHVGIFGGSFDTETLMEPVSELQEAYGKEGCSA